MRSLQQVPHLSDLQGTPPQPPFGSVPPPPLPPYPGAGGAMLPPPPQPRQQFNPPRHTPSAPPITHPPLSPEAQEDEGGQDGEQEAAPEVQEIDPGAALSPSFHSARARGDQRGVKMGLLAVLVGANSRTIRPEVYWVVPTANVCSQCCGSIGVRACCCSVLSPSSKPNNDQIKKIKNHTTP